MSAFNEGQESETHFIVQMGANFGDFRDLPNGSTIVPVKVLVTSPDERNYGQLIAALTFDGDFKLTDLNIATGAIVDEIAVVFNDDKGPELTVTHLPSGKTKNVLPRIIKVAVEVLDNRRRTAGCFPGLKNAQN